MPLVVIDLFSTNEKSNTDDREKETVNDCAPWLFVGGEACAQDDKINIEIGNKDENKACDVNSENFTNHPNKKSRLF